MKKALKRILIFVAIIMGILLLNAMRVYYHFDSEVENWTKQPNRALYNKEDYKNKLDSLKQAFGNNKILPEGYELQALLALSHYPELKNVKVTFVIEDALIPLASRPYFGSLFLGKDQWDYQVIISSKSTQEMESILLKNLTFNSQIGVLGHELAHTLYYQDKGFWDILGIGVCYLLSDYRAFFEKQTDRRALYHGLGKHLIHYAKEVRSGNMADKTQYVDAYYLSPEELEKLL